MVLLPDLRRLTYLGLAAVLSGLVGCSMFKEQASPKLTAQVTPGPAPAGPAAPKYVVEIRPDGEKPKAVEKPLQRQVALITGAGSGIGAATARAFAKAGAEVAIVDRDMMAAQKVAHSISSMRTWYCVSSSPAASASRTASSSRATLVALFSSR